MSDLLKFFRNPPKGGNERGVPTQNPMAPRPMVKPAEIRGVMGGGGLNIAEKRVTAEMAAMTDEERRRYYSRKILALPLPSAGPAAQTSLRDAMEAGENSSRNNIQQAALVGQTEMRNYDRSGVTQEADDPSTNQFYDMESYHDGRTGVVNGSGSAGTPTPEMRPHPVLNPDTTASMRSDGRPLLPMPGAFANAHAPNVTKDGALVDNSRDHPSHLIGRNGKGMAKHRKGKKCDDQDEDD